MPIDFSKLRKMTKTEMINEDIDKLNNPVVWLGRSEEDEPFKKMHKSKKIKTRSPSPISITHDFEKHVNIDLSKIPKDILINAHNQLMNKGVPENQRYYTSNISKATKDKVIEHIKKQKYSMDEFENLVNELYTNKKEENKKGLAKRKQNAKDIDEMNKPKNNIDIFINDKQKEIDEGLEKRKNKKKTYKENNIMKARSDLKKKGDKYQVETEMKVKKGLDKKVKSALKKSVISQLDKSIEGSGIRKIDLDYSSSEDEKPRKRGRPKKGKGLEYDDSSDEEDDIKTYGDLLEHLVKHIKDPKEKIDPNDFKQAIELIKKIKSKKGGTIKGRGDKEKNYTDKPFPKDFSSMREKARERHRIQRNEQAEKSEKLANRTEIQRQRLDLLKMRDEVAGLSDKAEKALDDMINMDASDLTKGKYQKMIKNLDRGMTDFYENKEDRMRIPPKLPDELMVKMHDLGIINDIPYHLIDSAKRRIEEEKEDKEGKGIRKRGRPRKNKKQ